MHVIERELLVIPAGQRAAPGIKNHHRLRARFDLRIQIQRDAFRQLIEQRMQGLRFGVHHLFDHRKRFAAAAFNHIGRQRPRAAGKANQRHFPLQLTANRAHGVHHVAKFIFRVGNR